MIIVIMGASKSRIADHDPQISGKLWTLDFIRDNLIGKDAQQVGPYGRKKMVYCDYTASGKSLAFLEDYIRNNVLPFYANTHSISSAMAQQTTIYRHEAREIIRQCVNAGPDDVVIFTGAGTTAAVHKVINAMGLNKPAIANKAVVFVGPFEHHSNILPWKETGAKVVRIRDTASGHIDYADLCQKLDDFKAEADLLIGAFSAASNVTGIQTDTVAVAELLHASGAVSLWDFATAAPYLTIDMNPTENGYKDAVFFSPHKFVGGVGTPGNDQMCPVTGATYDVELEAIRSLLNVYNRLDDRMENIKPPRQSGHSLIRESLSDLCVLIAKKALFCNHVPGGCGGGTVVYVTRESHGYLDNIEEREEGGTPAITESIRAGLVLKIKDIVGQDVIEHKETLLCRMGFQALKQNPNIVILGSHSAKCLPIFSILVKHPHSGKLIHHNFITRLLNDLYGVQDLLNIPEEVASKYIWMYSHGLPQDSAGGLDPDSAQEKPWNVIRPGFVRLNLAFFLDDKSLRYILNAVNMVATHGWKLLPWYKVDVITSEWHHVTWKPKWKSLKDFKLMEGVKTNRPPKDESCLSCDGKISYQKMAADAVSVIKRAPHAVKDVGVIDDLVDLGISETQVNYLWFLTPGQALQYLSTNQMKSKRVLSAGLRRSLLNRRSVSRMTINFFNVFKRRRISSTEMTSPRQKIDQNSIFPVSNGNITPEQGTDVFT